MEGLQSAVLSEVVCVCERVCLCVCVLICRSEQREVRRD